MGISALRQPSPGLKSIIQGPGTREDWVMEQKGPHCPQLLPGDSGRKITAAVQLSGCYIMDFSHCH